MWRFLRHSVIFDLRKNVAKNLKNLRATSLNSKHIGVCKNKKIIIKSVNDGKRIKSYL